METRFPATGFVALLGSLTIGAAVAAPVPYKIDPRHTFPTFQVSHMGFSLQLGRFDKTSGALTIDLAAKTGTVDVTIETASINMGFDTWNKNVDDRYLHSAEFPTMTFKSSKLRFKGDKLVAVDGALTLLGVTKPVKLAVDIFKCAPSPLTKKDVCGAHATTVIKRSEYGMMANLPDIGDEIKIAFGVEAIKE